MHELHCVALSSSSLLVFFRLKSYRLKKAVAGRDLEDRGGNGGFGSFVLRISLISRPPLTLYTYGRRQKKFPPKRAL